MREHRANSRAGKKFSVCRVLFPFSKRKKGKEKSKKGEFEGWRNEEVDEQCWTDGRILDREQ